MFNHMVRVSTTRLDAVLAAKDPVDALRRLHSDTNSRLYRVWFSRQKQALLLLKKNKQKTSINCPGCCNNPASK